MCATCGCSETQLHDGAPHAHDHHDHGHEHAHEHHHDHDGGASHAARSRVPRTLRLEHDVLAKNDVIAARTRAWLATRDVLALNLVSAPGAGKTTLLERTIRDLDGTIPMAVVEGDQETARDAERIRAAGCRAVQVNTGTGCHLDAAMVRRSVEDLDPPAGSLVMIENVGNLVCPALFDLGEAAKVVIVSVAEGDDKPLKYPHMFRASAVAVLNKIDLVPYVAFDVDRCVAHMRRVNPSLRVFRVSATRGDGLDDWYGWLHANVARDRRRSSDPAAQHL
jgi:hydrogenase nickel incorporation protein HypB